MEFGRRNVGIISAEKASIVLITQDYFEIAMILRVTLLDSDGIFNVKLSLLPYFYFLRTSTVAR